MIALRTQIKITLVLWEVFLLFLAALKPKHNRPAKQSDKAVINTCNQIIPQFISRVSLLWIRGVLREGIKMLLPFNFSLHCICRNLSKPQLDFSKFALNLILPHFVLICSMVARESKTSCLSE